MKLIQVVFVLLFACACGDGAKKTDTIELAFRFPAGTQYSYVTDSRQEIVQVTAGVNTEIKQEMRLSASYSVSAAGGSNKKLTVAYDGFYIKSESNGLTVEYDSHDTSKQPRELASAAQIVNRPFTLTVNGQGKILKVSLGADSNAITGSGISDSSIRQMMEQSLNVYPDVPVRPGDTWQRTYATNIGFMDMKVVSNYKLISVANGTAHISVDATITSAPAGNPQQQEMHLEMKGSQTGTMDIDIETGLILESRFGQDVSGTIRIPGVEIPVKLRSDTRILGKMAQREK